ncbi:MAG: hypothetical protein ChlgKO_13850 [Chlamydiales bacterium]
MITAAQHYSSKAIQMLDGIFGSKSSHGGEFNLIQKSALFGQHFFEEQKEYFQTPLAWSSICKTLLAPGIAARHLYYRGVETINLGQSYKDWRDERKTFTEFLLGDNREEVQRLGVRGSGVKLKDVASNSPSLLGWAVGLSKLAQKVSDSAGNLLYFTMPPSLTFSQESLKTVKEWKSTFQVVEYVSAFFWDATKLWNCEGSRYNDAFGTATNFFGATAATASAYRFHFMDKKSGVAHQVQGLVCTCAVVAAVLPYIKELFKPLPTGTDAA